MCAEILDTFTTEEDERTTYSCKYIHLRMLVSIHPSISCCKGYVDCIASDHREQRQKKKKEKHKGMWRMRGENEWQRASGALEKRVFGKGK